MLHYCCLFSIRTTRKMHDLQKYFSRTFQDQWFSRTFQVLEFSKKNPGLSRRHGNCAISCQQLPVSDIIFTKQWQESLADARVTRDSAIIPRWPSAAILDIIKPQIAPFDPPTRKTVAYNQTWSGSDAPFARYSPLNYTVTLKLGFRVTQGHRKRHH